MSKVIRVLVTCAGGGVGQSVVDSLKNYKETYFLIASDQRQYNFAIPDCDAFVELPSIFAPDYVQRVMKVCKDLDVDVLIPGHDQELELFALEREAFEAAGTAVVVSDHRLVKLLRNKLDWSREFRKKTDAVARSFSVDELPDRNDLPFPMIAKPTGGSASTGLHILHAAADAVDLPNDLVLQEFLFPPQSSPDYGVVKAAVDQKKALQVAEVSVQLVYSLNGELLGRFASMNRLSNGVPVEIVPLDEDVIWNTVSQIEGILEGYNPRGPINLQGRVTDTGLVLFEMNPRFTGITGNRAQFGFNEVDAVCRNFVNGEVLQLRTNFGKVGVRQVACRAYPREDFRVSQKSGEPSKNIVLLGGTSWLGRAFVNRYAGNGYNFVALVRPESMQKAHDLFKGFQDVELVSICDPGINNCFGWADVCLNLASARPPDGATRIRESYDFQLKWLAHAAMANVPKIVNVSSQSVYEAQSEAWHESSPVTVSTPYAFSKYSIEAHLKYLGQLHPQVSTVSLRLGRLFGPAEGLRKGEFPHLCVERAINGGEVEVSAPETIIDLLDIRDASSAIRFFIEGRQEGVFNIGSGEKLSILKFVATVKQRASQKCNTELKVIERQNESASPSHGGFMSCSNAAALGWGREFELNRTVDDLIDYLSSESG
ncbi:MAG: NAD-dependent epimerase/dehydratase family protein [Erythrobacter sp.]|nr:MAG: NAD-dependent epimerase/dehydratase family protein [Erythrobacter sp.]